MWIKKNDISVFKKDDAKNPQRMFFYAYKNRSKS